MEKFWDKVIELGTFLGVSLLGAAMAWGMIVLLIIMAAVTKWSFMILGLVK